ncbi:MAG: lipoprotein [Myxococcaceae bacterium]|nr:lipoprotein [Myxococcaceae bacterium]
MYGARALVALPWLLQAGCDRHLVLGRWGDAAPSSADVGVIEPSANPQGDAGPTEAGQPGPGVFACDRRGPLFDLTDGYEGACGVGSRGFHYAVCSCSDVVAAMPVDVDGFDSRQGVYVPGQASGALASVGALYPHALRVGGSLIVAGSAGIPLNADLVVGGNLLDQGQLQGQYAVSVAGQARIGGDVRLSHFAVSGSATVAPSAALSVSDGSPDAARDAVQIAAPCRCDAPFDVAAVIDAASRDNDNALLALDGESALKAFAAALELTLPCGRYYVGEIYGARPITLHVQGRVALYVQNGIVLENTGALTIELADGAELDMFVRNGISAGGPVQIGAPTAATHARLHFGATDSLFFLDKTMLAATLYAPRSELVSHGAFELYGAALVRRWSADGTLQLHYDRALSADACPAASCRSDTQCAPTLRCDHGSCLP